ncbi:hypothetical protein CBER1_03480 [Cercospora berteroae]|uniref:WW domain-containing protein n=1 Tax=Cercospora berteroae TaxID=357750 RepID=A0A2S6CLS5_9PEZI|nr:hypothetical protein CBER1_03480 [Cercospora berteroae]
MARSKGKQRTRTVHGSCQRCTQLRLFCDVPGSCSQCRKRGCICSPAGSEVPNGRKAAIDGEIREPSGTRVESGSSNQPPSTAPPPAGQLPQGWECFHDSETNRDYYVSPTGHIQWSHPLQGPIPPPLPQALTTTVRGFPLGRVGAAYTNNAPSQYPTRDNKRKRGEEDVQDLPAPSRTRAYSIPVSTTSRPTVRGFRIPPHIHANSTTGAPPSGPRSMRQPLSRGEVLGGSRYTGTPTTNRPGGLQRGPRTTTSVPFSRREERILPTQTADDEVEGSQEALEQVQTKAHADAVKIEEEGAADEQELVKPDERVKEEEPRDFGLRSRSKG